MKKIIRMAEHFGEFCSDGRAAVKFRREEIEPHLSLFEELELDFAGIRNANSSFCNGLLSGLVARHSPAVIHQLRIVNSNSPMRVMLAAALQLGVQLYASEGAEV